MRFDRGLRSLALKPYPIGYIAASTDDINPDIPKCQFGKSQSGGVWVGDHETPDLLGLQVYLSPIWVDNETSWASIAENRPCLLYPSKSVYSKVCIGLKGNRYYQMSTQEEPMPFMGDMVLTYQLSLPKPFLYLKEFIIQPKGLNISCQEEPEHQGAVPRLWAYGAQQIDDDIHPIVFSLDCVREETILAPSSLVSWRERGVIPQPAGGLRQGSGGFQDAYEEDQTRTLRESLEAGLSIIHLILGVDEIGKPLMIPYYSYRFAKNTIHYKKGGPK
jgi:hypothetical protein